MSLALFLAGAAVARAQGEDPHPNAYGVSEDQPVVVLVVVNAVGLRELVDAPVRPDGIRRLLTSGGVGLMNARTAAPPPIRPERPVDSLVVPPDDLRPMTLESGCLSLGAGTRCFTREEGGQAFDAGETVEGCRAPALWVQRTGGKPGDSSIFMVSLPRVASEQAGLPYAAAPGALGQALSDAGILTAVVGNADDASGPHREAACIAMDRLGRVPLGSVGQGFAVADAAAPGGFHTDSQALLDAAGDALARGARFLVVETGDTARVDRDADEIQAAARPMRRREAIRRADRIVAGLLDRLDPAASLLILLSPTPSLDAARSGGFLTPVLMAGAGVPPRPGLLSSPSTRTAGLVTNTDIAATVLSFLEVRPPAQVVGRPLEVKPETRSVSKLLAALAGWERVERYARPLGRELAWGQFAVLAALLFLMWVRPAPSPGDRRLLRAGGLLLASLPAAILLCGLPSPGSPAEGALLLLLFAGALAAAAALLGRWLPAAGVVWLPGAALLLGDLLAGSRLLQRSPLGYSPFAGARYYGIGNEGVGLLLPAVFLGVLFLARPRAFGGAERGKDAEERRTPLLLAAGAALAAAVLIGHPSVGAKFGGAMTAAVLGAAAAYPALRERVPRGVLLGVCAVGAVALALLPAGLELIAGGGHQSHIGQAVALIRSGGIVEALPIAARKLHMSLLLLQLSPWSRLLGAGAVAVAFLLFRVRAVPRDQRAAVGALCVGAVAALATSDAGVIPAAEMLAAAAAFLLIRAGGEPADVAPAGEGKGRRS